MSWYYLNESGEVVGPVSEQALKELNAVDVLATTSQVCREGTEEWIGLAEVLGVDADTSGEGDSFKFSCPQCSQEMAAEAPRTGESAQCPSCGAEFVIPSHDTIAATNGPLRKSARNGRLWKVTVGVLVLIFVIVGAITILNREPSAERITALLELADSHARGRGVPQNWQLAAKYLQEAADEGSADAQCRLASCYRYGHGVEKNDRTATFWTRKAAEGGDALAQYNLAVSYLKGSGVEESPSEMIRWLRLSADQGLAQAQCHLGLAYADGTGVDTDSARAVELFAAAADQGFPEAQYQLGTCLWFGDGVTKDEARGLGWIETAAAQGHIEAQSYLGAHYLHISEEEAFRWYQMAASQGSANDQCAVGNCYRTGIGVKPDQEEAFQWYMRAAEQGNAYGQKYVAGCYDAGLGVRRDPAAAVHWLEKAAEQGNSEAQRDLGAHYFSGEGVEQNEALAFKWLSIAADQNEAEAQFLLGQCYLEGRGIAENQAVAYMWMTIAASSGDPDILSYLDKATKTLPPETIALGKRMSEELKDGKTDDFPSNSSTLSRKKTNQEEDSPDLDKNGKSRSEASLGTKRYGDHPAEPASTTQRDAADQSNPTDPEAQFLLGMNYQEGAGVPQSLEQAASWYRKAAKQGEPQALYALALFYMAGKGVDQDAKESLFLFSEAANQGHHEAQFCLGSAHKGVLSYMWLNLAATSGDAKVASTAREQRDDVARSLTHEEIAKGQKLSQEWEPGDPNTFGLFLRDAPSQETPVEHSESRTSTARGDTEPLREFPVPLFFPPGEREMLTLQNYREDDILREENQKVCVFMWGLYSMGYNNPGALPYFEEHYYDPEHKVSTDQQASFEDRLLSVVRLGAEDAAKGSPVRFQKAFGSDGKLLQTVFTREEILVRHFGPIEFWEERHGFSERSKKVSENYDLTYAAVIATDFKLRFDAAINAVAASTELNPHPKPLDKPGSKAPRPTVATEDGTSFLPENPHPAGLTDEAASGNPESALAALSVFENGTLDEAKECIRLLDEELKIKPQNERAILIKNTIMDVFRAEASITLTLKGQQEAAERYEVMMRSLSMASSPSRLTGKVNTIEINRIRRESSELKANANAGVIAAKSELLRALKSAHTSIPSFDNTALLPVWEKVAKRHGVSF